MQKGAIAYRTLLTAENSWRCRKTRPRIDRDTDGSSGVYCDCLLYENTPVHWGKIHPIKQEYSLVRRKKFIGMKTVFYTYQSHLHCIGVRNKKAENPLRRNQKLATSEDFS